MVNPPHNLVASRHLLTHLELWETAVASCRACFSLFRGTTTMSAAVALSGSASRAAWDAASAAAREAWRAAAHASRAAARAACWDRMDCAVFIDLPIPQQGALTPLGSSICVVLTGFELGRACLLSAALDLKGFVVVAQLIINNTITTFDSTVQYARHKACSTCRCCFRDLEFTLPSIQSPPPTNHGGNGAERVTGMRCSLWGVAACRWRPVHLCRAHYCSAAFCSCTHLPPHTRTPARPPSRKHTNP